MADGSSVAAVRGRRRTNDPEGMRRRVIETAAAAFQARGYHATSMHDILRDAGVTAGALYHHFPTKKALGLAVIAEAVVPAVEERWIVPFRSAPTAAEGIAQVFGGIAAELEGRGAVQGCPLNNLALELSLADPDFRTALNGLFEGWQAAIADRLAADRPAGDPQALATLVVSAYSGAMTLAKTAQDATPLRACLDPLLPLLRAARMPA